MALTKIKTDGVTDDAITSGKIPANAVGASELADNAVDSAALAADCVIGSKIADLQIATEHIVNDAVTADKLASSSVTNDSIANDSIHGDKISTQTISLSKFVHGTSSNDGKFLRANNGADPTFETIAQPDLTNLSASNLTSGTVPDARFPATLPAASAANLTSIPAANITGTLPAISGANLTNLPAGGKITRVLVATNSGATTTNSTSYVEHLKLTVTNVTSNARYVVYFNYEFGSQTSANYGAHNHIQSFAYSQIQHTGGTLTGGNGSYLTQRNVISDMYVVPISLVKYDEASNTTDRTYSIEVKSSTTTSGHAGIAKHGTIVALEYTV